MSHLSVVCALSQNKAINLKPENSTFVYIPLCPNALILMCRAAVGHLTRKSGVLGSIPGLATCFCFSFRFFKKGWRKYVHEVLVNRLGGLSLPRKSVVRLTDHPDMTLDVYRGRKTTIQQKFLHDVF